MIHRYQTVDSTMVIASRLAAEGAPSGTAVVAEEQTAGRGRFGRSWHSEPGAGLYVSVILRYPFSPIVTLALGLGTRSAIGVPCDLRWPNDVLIDGRKCAGILTQLEGTAVIAGFGINVNHSAFPPELEPIATSLRIATGRPHSREQILTDLLPAIDQYCEILSTQGPDPILDMFTHASSYVSGRRVTVDDGSITGTTAGLTSQGFLQVRDDAGKLHQIISGGVRPWTP